MRSKNTLLGALIALLAACDSPTQPTALITAETRAAIRIASVLPTLPALIDAADSVAPVEARGRLAHARSLWQLAQVLGPEADARQLRDEAYAEAIPILSATLTEVQLAGAFARLREWTALAGAVVRPGAIPGFSAALEDGQALLRRAEAAGLEGRRADALGAVLRAAERLDTTTPRAVAVQLTRAAEDALARTSEAADPERHARANRLTRGAREALIGRNFELAIRRAYYAGQLLRGTGDSVRPDPPR